MAERRSPFGEIDTISRTASVARPTDRKGRNVHVKRYEDLRRMDIVWRKDKDYELQHNRMGSGIAICKHSKGHGSYSIDQVEGADAARRLMIMMAMSPAYHHFNII